jgi:L-serine dehydratase
MRAKQEASRDAAKVPYPFSTAKQMLDMAQRSGLSISQMKRANEECRVGREELDEGLDRIWDAMRSHRPWTEGRRHHAGWPERPPPRRAIHDKLAGGMAQQQASIRLLANDWLSVYAMAVNEENAAGGRVVTAPTNGAAGVVPATIRYYEHFHDDGIRTASATTC